MTGLKFRLSMKTPVMLVAALLAVTVASACASSSDTTAQATAVVSATNASSPTNTPVSAQTATPQPTAAATSTAVPNPTPSPTATPEPRPMMVSAISCTQLYPGVFNPDGPTSFLSGSAKLTNTGDVDVPVKIGLGGGAVIFFTFFDAPGGDVTTRDDTLATTSLEAGQTYEVSVSGGLFTSQNVATCEFGILGENGRPVKLSGEYRAEVEQIFAP